MSVGARNVRGKFLKCPLWKANNLTCTSWCYIMNTR